MFDVPFQTASPDPLLGWAKFAELIIVALLGIAGLALYKYVISPLSKRIDEGESSHRALASELANFIKQEGEARRASEEIRRLQLEAVEQTIRHNSEVTATAIGHLTTTMGKVADIAEKIQAESVSNAQEIGRQAERLHSAVGYIDRVATRAGVSDLQIGAQNRRKGDKT